MDKIYDAEKEKKLAKAADEIRIAVESIELAIKTIEELAESGYANAQYWLGRDWQDIRLNKMWDVDSQAYLEKARKIYETAAAQGDAEAMVALADYAGYEENWDTRRDYLAKAAGAGNYNAQMILGDWYLDWLADDICNGAISEDEVYREYVNGYEDDELWKVRYDLANHYFDMAAVHGDVDTLNKIAEYYREAAGKTEYAEDYIWAECFSKKAVEARKKADEKAAIELRSYEVAATRGDVDVMSACVADEGDIVRGRNYLKSVAEAGNTKAQMQLGILYLYGYLDFYISYFKNEDEEYRECIEKYGEDCNIGYELADKYFSMVLSAEFENYTYDADTMDRIAGYYRDFNESDRHVKVYSEYAEQFRNAYYPTP